MVQGPHFRNTCIHFRAFPPQMFFSYRMCHWVDLHCEEPTSLTAAVCNRTSVSGICPLAQTALALWSEVKMQIEFLCSIEKTPIFLSGNLKGKNHWFLELSNWHKCLEQKPGDKDLKTEATVNVKIKELQSWYFFFLEWHCMILSKLISVGDLNIRVH